MFSFRSLIADPALTLRLLADGAPGALDAEVLWVHTTELPDPSAYVRPRELVLTNGLWHTGAASSEDFVASVVRAEGAGVVFGLRDDTPTTPADLVAACRSAGLPLAEISAAVPFTAVSQAAAAIYAEQRQVGLVGLVRRGNALADALSRGAGASGVLRLLRREHALPLAVVDRMGRLLAAAGAALDPDGLQTVARALTHHPPPLEVDLGPAGRASVFLVGAVGDVDAALLCLAPVTALNRDQHEALDQAARFLSLEVARQQAVQAIELRFASELLDMILSGPQRAAEVPGRLQAFGIDASGPLAVCAVAFAEGEAATLPGLAEAVNEFFVATGTPVVVAGGSGDVVAVFPWRRPSAELAALAEGLAAAVGRAFPETRPVVGLSAPVTGGSGLRRPLVESREACRVLRRRPGGGPAVSAFHQLGTHRLLLGLHDRETLGRFADGVLGPLREHDTRRGGALEATLRTFLDHDGQWTPTAAALFIHVNTLRNRLVRITELTGLDVTRTQDRVDLFLALEADAAAGDPGRHSAG